MNKVMNIALIAHDARKAEMLEWVQYNWETLSRHKLFATGTTGRLIENLTFDVEFDEHGQTVKETISPFKGKVTCLLSGPLGGDAQISAGVAEDRIDAVIFFCDNLIVQGHQNDVLGLNRIGGVYNVPFAINRTTADMIITSPLFGNPNYKRIIPKCIEDYNNRTLNL